jgi:hypothetical protein
MGLQTLFLAFLTVTPTGPAPGVVGHEPPARVEVLAGRATVGLPSAVLRLEAGAPVQQFVGPVHLEVAAASRARVGWSSVGSLVLEGRGVVEWRAPRERGELMRWTFVEVDSASLEVRRGRVHLELPGGWRGLLQPGAYTLAGLAGGPVELHHDAGLPVTLWPPQAGAGSRAQPPYTLLAGGAVRLLGEAPRPVTLPASADPVQAPHDRLGFESSVASARGYPAWNGFSWPWRRAEEASAPRPRSLPGRGPLGERLKAPAPVPRPASETRSAGVEAQGGAPDPEAEAPPSDELLRMAAASGNDAPAPGGAAGPATPGAEADEPGAPRGNGGLETRPPLWTFLPLRSSGELVLTPYGPRWVDVAALLSQLRRPSEPATPRP